MDAQLVSTTFGAQSTAAEVIAGVDLSAKRAIVTGSSSGIGAETARALASAGAEVTLAVRDAGAGERVAAEISAGTGNGKVFTAPLDLADRASVAAFVASWHGPLDILVNNAGIMASPELRTPEGWEMQFATNHLGHFALATGLHDALAAAGSAGAAGAAGGAGGADGAGAAGGARVVVVSSRGHLNGEVLFDDINFERHPYDRWQAYSQSKTANILFAVEAARRWAPDGITVNALTPGRIRTRLLRFIGDETTASAPASFEATNPEFAWKTVEQGAATSVLLAASPLVEGVTGRYFEDCNEAGPRQPGILRGVADYAVDPGKAARLWQISVAALAG
jgi:NAD(P)-dependent dehydrogenase (short-subunit alcohol dehydrogenase family)